jgi:hypothetical protein
MAITCPRCRSRLDWVEADVVCAEVTAQVDIYLGRIDLEQPDTVRANERDASMLPLPVGGAIEARITPDSRVHRWCPVCEADLT